MGVLKIWDGTAWQTSSASGDGASVFVGPDAPPGTPGTGDLWYDTDQTSQLVLPLTVSNGGTGGANASAARANLGVNLPLAIADGGTGGTTAATARTALTVPAAGQHGAIAGAPTSGTWVRGDFYLDANNTEWVCTNGGTPGTWASVATSGQELAYDQITGDVAITATSVGTAQQLINGTAVNYDGRPVLLEFFTPRLDAPNNSQTLLNLKDGGTDLGYLALMMAIGSTGGTGATITSRKRFTPTAGIHTYNVVGYVGTGTGRLSAGPGNNAGQFQPAYLRITRA